MHVSQNVLQMISSNNSKAADLPVSLKVTSKMPDGMANTVIKGEITQARQNGEIIIKTSDGKELKAKMDPPLPQGTKLSFVPQKNGDTKLLQIKLSDEAMAQIQKEQEANQQKQVKQQNTNDNKQQSGRQPQEQTQQQNQSKTKQSHHQQTVSKPVTNQDVANQVKQQTDNLSQQKIQQQVQQTANQSQQSMLKTLLQTAKQSVTGKAAELIANAPKPVPIEQLPKLLQGKTLPVHTSTLGQNLPKEGTKLLMEVTTLPRKDGSQVMREVASKDIPKEQQIAVSNGQESKLQSLKLFPPQPLPKNTQLVLKFLTGQQAQISDTKLPTEFKQDAPQQTPIKNDAVKLSTAGQKAVQQPLQTGTLRTPLQNIKTELPTNQLIQAKVLPTVQSSTPSVNNNLTQQTISKPLTTVQLQSGQKLELNIPQAIKTDAVVNLKFTQLANKVEVQVFEATQHTNTSNKQLSNQPVLKAEIPLPAEGQRMVAKVIESSPRGLHTIETTDGQKFVVQANRRLPVGFNVSLQVGQNGQATITDLLMPGASNKLQQLTKFAFQWEGLQKAIDTLQQHKPELAQKLIDKLPQAEKNFLPSMIALSDAIRTQKLEKIFSEETLNILRALGVDLTADTQQLSQTQTRQDSQGESWKAMFFPYVADDDSLHQGNFFWKNSKEEDENSTNQTQFVINFSMTEMGPIQLDGTMHNKQLNLILRAQTLPNETFEKELQQVVHDTLDKFDMSGSIAVQVEDYFETDPLYELLTDDSSVGLNI